MMKIILSIIIWILYLEINPQIGNIWIRKDEYGNNNIYPMNILYFIFNSLSLNEFYSLEFLWENVLTAIPSIYTILSLLEIIIKEYKFIDFICKILLVILATLIFLIFYYL